MNKRLFTAGFSLVEMAIVLVIISLLLAGLLPMISSQMEQQRRTETRKQLDDIRGALIGYATSQTPPKLPCPASPSIPTGTVNAGVEARTGGVCTITSGVLPWVTLGTNETDAWGRRFTYSVTAVFASSVALTSTGNLNVKTATTGTTIAANMPAVIVSHGVNGSGAWMPEGNQLAVSTDADEATNSTSGTLTFVSHDMSPTFDDMVVWVSPNTLFNRLVTAGKLP